MGVVVVDQRGTRLEYGNGAMTVRVPEQMPRRVPLRLMDRLVIAAAVQLDSTLLTHLAENDISVLVMPGRGAHRGTLLYGHAHGNIARRLAQYHTATDVAATLGWARRFVILRICGAQRLLNAALQTRPELRYALSRGIARLRTARTHAHTAASVDSLRGIEGAAGAAYFAAFQTLFAETLAFQGRNRRPPRDPVNAALSLGYTLANADAARAIVTAGLDPMLGFLHEPAYNRDSLVCDFVELARPRIERIVWRLFAEKKLEASSFSNDNGACRMHKAARETFYAHYENNAGVHRRAFRRLARIMARSLERQPSLPSLGDAP